MDNLNLSLVHSASEIAAIDKQMKENMRIEQEIKHKRDSQERENHDNLDYIAKSAKESNEILKEMNEALKESNMLLREKNEELRNSVDSIQNVLELMFSVDSMNKKQQSEQLESIAALACQISESLDRGEKIDWKNKFADLGVMAAFETVKMVLGWKGLL